MPEQSRDIYRRNTLENAMLSLPEHQEKVVWLVDFTGWTRAHANPIKTSSECISVVQNHYPERLSIAFMLNAPKVFELSFKVQSLNITPFINIVYC